MIKLKHIFILIFDLGFVFLFAIPLVHSPVLLVASFVYFIKRVLGGGGKKLQQVKSFQNGA